MPFCLNSRKEKGRPMKVKQIVETAAANVTSVANIGTIEYAAFNGNIKLYRRGYNKPIARFMRQPNKGWKFTPTNYWVKSGLPHFGYLYNTKPEKSGTKTIEKHMEDMFKKWGIKYDRVIKRDKQS